MSAALALQQLCADIAAGTATAADREAARNRLDALDLYVSFMGEQTLSAAQREERLRLREALACASA